MKKISPIVHTSMLIRNLLSGHEEAFLIALDCMEKILLPVIVPGDAFIIKQKVHVWKRRFVASEVKDQLAPALYIQVTVITRTSCFLMIKSPYQKTETGSTRKQSVYTNKEKIGSFIGMSCQGSFSRFFKNMCQFAV